MEKLKKLFGLLKANQKKVATIGAMFLFVVALGFTCAFNLTKDVRITVDTSEANVEPQVVEVSANMNKTVGEILNEQEISTDGYDVSSDLDSKIRDVDEISLKATVSGTITVDGQQVPFTSSADTIGDLLTEQNITLGDNDVVTPSADTKLTKDITGINIDRVEIKEEQRQEEIPFETQETEDADVTKDEVVVDQQGENGVKVITESVKYVNGQRAEATTIKEEVTKEAVPQVQRKGTKVETASTDTSASTSSSDSGSGSSSSSSSGGYTATAVSVSDSDFETICAIVAHEGGTSYEGAAAVMSAVMNRYDAGYASTVLGVLTAPGQFSSYLQGYYTQYLGAAIPNVRQAVTDCLNGYRMHGYKNFHAGHGSSGEYIVNQTFY